MLHTHTHTLYISNPYLDVLLISASLVEEVTQFAEQRSWVLPLCLSRILTGLKSFCNPRAHSLPLLWLSMCVFLPWEEQYTFFSLWNITVWPDRLFFIAAFSLFKLQLRILCTVLHLLWYYELIQPLSCCPFDGPPESPTPGPCRICWL